MQDKLRDLSPFPPRLPGYGVFGTARELLGTAVPESTRIDLWKNLSLTQVLPLLAAILNDLDINIGSVEKPVSEIDDRWISKITSPTLKTYLTIGSTLNVRMFVPQIVLIAVKEALLHCPDSVPVEETVAFDAIVLCLLGIGDDCQSTQANDKNESWGSMDAKLASELIANLHFNQNLWVGRQLVWFEQTWFNGWSKNSLEAASVGGNPDELFAEATGVDLTEFAAIAMSLHTQSHLHNYVRFPAAYFDTLELSEKTVEHFLVATSCSSEEMRQNVMKDGTATGAKRFNFDVFRRFPLLRLSNGEYVLISPKFMLQRALSETTFWDVRNHLRNVDPRRDEAFHLCTTRFLEDEARERLNRIFRNRKGRVLEEGQLQRKFGSKSDTPSVCDFAIRAEGVWLLIEVTDRSMVRPIVSANASAEQLDAELDTVLTLRKAGQLYSTIQLLSNQFALDEHAVGTQDRFIPLVLTGENGLPWTLPVYERTKERLAERGFPDEFCSSVALITPRDLSMLENAANSGYSVMNILLSWRRDNPAHPLDTHFHSLGIRINSPKWEKDRVHKVIRRFTASMGSTQ